MDNKIKTEPYDALDTWRNDIRTYAGSCDQEDTMVTAIKEEEKYEAARIAKENYKNGVDIKDVKDPLVVAFMKHLEKKEENSRSL